MGIALRRRAVASYMRRLQYLRRCQQLSIENDAAPHIVGPPLCILSYHGLLFRNLVKEGLPTNRQLPREACFSLSCACDVGFFSPFGLFDSDKFIWLAEYRAVS